MVNTWQGDVFREETDVIDLHTHVLPGVDDGPTSWDEALDLVRMAAAEGISAIAATSHMMPDGAFANHRADLLPLIDQLRQRLRENQLDVVIYAGGEVYMSPDVIARMERGELLTYCDAGRYMLLEMPASEIPAYAVQVIADLRAMGVTPIIAHPERNIGIIEKPQRAEELVQHGALLQVNGSSLRSDNAVRRAAKYLFTRGLVHFLATDAHGVRRRRPRLQNYVRVVEGWIGPAAADKLVRDNPAAVIAGQALQPAHVPERRGLRARLRDALRGRGMWQ